MKNVIAAALFFVAAAAPALAGGSSRVSPGFTAPRSFAPQAPEAPMKPVAEPQRKPIRTPWISVARFDNARTMCPKNPYQQPNQQRAGSMSGCAVNPWVLYAFPEDL
jgi:hypothetical protein